jgi:hypothetical protein
MSRPFSLISQSGGKFSMSSIESSNVYGKPPLNRWLTFASINYCLIVQEGLIRVKIKYLPEAIWYLKYLMIFA